MNNRPAALSFGWNLGILSGLFAALQVLISASSARANIASIESMRWSLARLTTGGGNPTPLIGSLAPTVLITYASMVVTGAICLGLCWYAGRLTAYVNGNRGGAGAGFQVALLSGIIWIAFGVVISLLLHSDGTITGVVASTRDGSSLSFQLGGLLIQQILFASIGLGLGAWAGALGSRSAPPGRCACHSYPRSRRKPPMACIRCIQSIRPLLVIQAIQAMALIRSQRLHPIRRHRITIARQTPPQRPPPRHWSHQRRPPHLQRNSLLRLVKQSAVS